MTTPPDVERLASLIADVDEVDQKLLTALLKTAVKLNHEKGYPTKR